MFFDNEVEIREHDPSEGHDMLHIVGHFLRLEWICFEFELLDDSFHVLLYIVNFLKYPLNETYEIKLKACREK